MPTVTMNPLEAVGGQPKAPEYRDVPIRYVNKAMPTVTMNPLEAVGGQPKAPQYRDVPIRYVFPIGLQCGYCKDHDNHKTQ